MHAAQEEKQNLTSVQSVCVCMNESGWRLKKMKKWSAGNVKEAMGFFLKIKQIFSLLFQDEYRKNYISEEES